MPVAEFQLITETIRRFRTSYVAQFGAATPDDLLYEAVSEGRRHPGMEHWLPLFHDSLDTLTDYLPGASLVLDHLTDDAVKDRLEQIANDIIISPATGARVDSGSGTFTLNGDQASETGSSVSHAFANPGTYSVAVSATDAAGNRQAKTASNKLVVR